MRNMKFIDMRNMKVIDMRNMKGKYIRNMKGRNMRNMKGKDMRNTTGQTARSKITTLMLMSGALPCPYYQTYIEKCKKRTLLLFSTQPDWV